MKLQELLKERERIDKELEKYAVEMKKREDLIQWRDKIKNNIELPMIGWKNIETIPVHIPDHIREIIVNALQSEIDKLEKE